MIWIGVFILLLVSLVFYSADAFFVSYERYSVTKSFTRSLSMKATGAKSKEEVFFCEACGVEHIKWMGRCPACKEWNTIKQFRTPKLVTSLDPRTASNRGMSTAMTKPKPKLVPLSVGTAPQGAVSDGRWLKQDVYSGNSIIFPMKDISDSDLNLDRINLFSGEMNRVLGGGLVRGSVILIAGDPGVGKSTLLLQLASSLGHANVVYVSGEENPQQIVLRARRLGLSSDGIFLICDVDIDQVLYHIQTLPTLPALVIIDSIQTMRTADSAHSIGSITQIKDSTAKVIQFAKSTSTSVILVGHVTKTGDVAGPRVLEHMVDTVLCIEGSERTDYRMLRAEKNRFGSVSEVGVFTMTEHGMTDVTNPSELFLTSSVITTPQEGSAVVIVMEGSRPILAEVQCLVSQTYSSSSQQQKINAKRAVDGFPMQRLLLISAVIEKRLKISMWNRDVYLNIVGGLRLTEPSADLAVAMAIISSHLSVQIQAATAFIGEIGLGGELRGGKRIEQRVNEAIKLGFTRVIVPATSGYKKSSISSSMSSSPVSPAVEAGVKIIPCSTLREACQHGLVLEPGESIDSIIAKRQRNNSGNKKKKQQEMSGSSGSSGSSGGDRDRRAFGHYNPNAPDDGFDDEEDDDDNGYHQ